MDDDGIFAKKLKYLFDHKTKPDGTKYTPNDIQAKTNNAITASYIWRLLSGKASNPSFQVIRTLSEFFDVEPGFFFDEHLPDVESYIEEALEDDLTQRLAEKLALRARNLGDEEMKMLLSIFELIDQIRKETQDDQEDSSTSQIDDS
jgi:transcriptional regulator with XRE-family HTH domain